jgi:hypothetical protein
LKQIKNDSFSTFDKCQKKSFWSKVIPVRQRKSASNYLERRQKVRENSFLQKKRGCGGVIKPPISMGGYMDYLTTAAFGPCPK